MRHAIACALLLCACALCLGQVLSFPVRNLQVAGCTNEFDGKYGAGYCKARKGLCKMHGEAFGKHCKLTCDMCHIAAPTQAPTPLPIQSCEIVHGQEINSYLTPFVPSPITGLHAGSPQECSAMCTHQDPAQCTVWVYDNTKDNCHMSKQKTVKWTYINGHERGERCESFNGTLGPLNGVKATTYEFMKVKAFKTNGPYAHIMVHECNLYGGMKPVCDNPTFCRHDPYALYLGQTGHIAYPPHRKAVGMFPTGWMDIQHHWNGLCSYTNDLANSALCNQPLTGHSFMMVADDPYFMCAKVLHSCGDGAKNGQEEQVDCGGPDCPVCTSAPTTLPTTSPTTPTGSPTSAPTTPAPTALPSVAPTATPTLTPTSTPTTLADTCDFGQLMMKMHLATTNCPGLEAGHAPTVCAPTCAEHFLRFWDTCGTFLEMLGMQKQIREYGIMATTCMDSLYKPGSCGADCSATNFKCRTHEIKLACCDVDHDCTASGNHIQMPTACGFECSLIFPRWYKECKVHILAEGSPFALAADTASKLETVNSQCIAQDPSKVLDVLFGMKYNQHCRLDFSHVAVASALAHGAAPAGATHVGAHNRRRAQHSGGGSMMHLFHHKEETCKWNEFNTRLSEVDNVCCTPNTPCADGVPSSCNAACGVTFNALYTDCEGTMRSLMGPSMVGMTALDKTCKSLDVPSLLQVAEKAQCDRCDDGRQNGDEVGVDCGGSCGAACAASG